MRLDEQLRNLAEEIENGQVPVSVDEIMGIGSGAGDAAGHRSGRSSRRWLLAAVAAAIIVVFVLGLVVFAGRDPDALVPSDTTPVETAPATTTPSDTTPVETAPATTTPSDAATPLGRTSSTLSFVQSGETITTPVGDFRFTAVEGDATTLSLAVDFEYDGWYYGADMAGTTWRSNDGLNWTEGGRIGASAFGVPSVEVDDVIWRTENVVGEEGTARLLRWDGTQFVAVELPELEDPDIPGLRPLERSLKISQFRGELAIIATTSYRIDPGMIDVADGRRYDMEVDPTEPGVVQIVTSGNVVGHVGPWPGLEAEELRAHLENGPLLHTQLLIGGDAGFDVVAAPRANTTIRAVADVDGRLLALAYNRSGFAVERLTLWATDDLLSWTELDPPHPDGVMHFDVALVGDGDGAVLAALEQAWFTDDGEEWQLLDVTAFDETFSTDFGWVKLPATFDSGLTIAVSVDGMDWHHLALDCPLPPGSIQHTSVVGNTIFVAAIDSEDDDNRVICVATVDGG